VATTSRIPIDIRRFAWIRPLVADYAFDHAKVADFFAGDPRDPHAWREAIARTRAHRDRSTRSQTSFMHSSSGAAHPPTRLLRPSVCAIRRRSPSSRANRRGCLADRYLRC
jgi:hypothetical protein